MIAPILCFTADEIWKAMPHTEGDDMGNIMLNDMAAVCAEYDMDEATREKWNRLSELRDEVNKALENARNEKVIGKPLEAWVTVNASKTTSDFLNNCGLNMDELAALSVVSKLRVVYNAELDDAENDISVEIERASGDKCERCWMYVDSIGKNEKHPTLCARCAEVVG